MISTRMRTCPLFGIYFSFWHIFAHKSLSFWWPFESWWFVNLDPYPYKNKICEMFCYSFLTKPSMSKISNKMSFVTWKQAEKTLRKREKVKINLQWKKPWLVYFDYNRCGSKCIKLHPPCLSISVRQMIVLKIR